jgi:hypothetical protein
VLFFELIAPFMALFSVIVAVALYVQERRARRDPAEKLPRERIRPPKPTGPDVPERGGRRPSMSP